MHWITYRLRSKKERSTVCAGENGAGKSTLINLCGGVFEPTEGTILIHGKEERINRHPKI